MKPRPPSVRDTTSLRIVVAEASPRLLGSLGPILDRGALSVQRMAHADEALELLVAEPIDGVVIGFPLSSIPFPAFLHGLRSPASRSRTANLLVAVERGQRGVLAPYLDEGGIDEVVSPDDDPLLVQHAVSDLLGVAPRAAVRLVLRVEARVGPNNGTASLLCTSVDLSLTGALIESEQLLPIGTMIFLRLFVPDRREPVDVQAQVVRHADPRFDRARGFAVRFVAIDSDGKRALEAFLDREEG